MQFSINFIQSIMLTNNWLYSLSHLLDKSTAITFCHPSYLFSLYINFTLHFHRRQNQVWYHLLYLSIYNPLTNSSKVNTNFFKNMGSLLFRATYLCMPLFNVFFLVFILWKGGFKLKIQLYSLNITFMSHSLQTIKTAVEMVFMFPLH